MGKRNASRDNRQEMVLFKIQNNHKRGLSSVLEMGIGLLMGFFLSQFLIAKNSGKKRPAIMNRETVEAEGGGSIASEGPLPALNLKKSSERSTTEFERVSDFFSDEKNFVMKTRFPGGEMPEGDFQEDMEVRYDLKDRIPEHCFPRGAVPEDYSPEEAAADGCFVLVEGEIFANEEALRAFAEKAGQGTPNGLRVVNYYEELGDVALITDITYDGTIFHYFHDETRLGNQSQQIWKRTFGYLHVVEEGALYYLANQKEITYEEYKQNLMSSDGKGVFDQATIYWGKPSFDLYAAI